MNGDEDLLITDPAGRRIGDGPAKKTSLKEIPRALENPILGKVLEGGGEEGSFGEEECEEVEDEEPPAGAKG